jgi:hypothetical protein
VIVVRNSKVSQNNRTKVLATTITTTTMGAGTTTTTTIGTTTITTMVIVSGKIKRITIRFVPFAEFLDIM